MTYPMSIYRCFVFNDFLKVAKFRKVKTKASSKRLFHYVIPTHPPQSIQLDWGIGVRMRQIYN